MGASGAPQYFIADTPEVQAAKAQFAAAWNAAAARNQVAPVHEAPRSAQHFVPAAPVQQYAPVQQADPAYYNPAAYAYAPVAPVAPVQAGCYNWKGVAVECRY